jgi:hypothetical protein
LACVEVQFWPSPKGQAGAGYGASGGVELTLAFGADPVHVVEVGAGVVRCEMAAVDVDFVAAFIDAGGCHHFFVPFQVIEIVDLMPGPF